MYIHYLYWLIFSNGHQPLAIIFNPSVISANQLILNMREAFSKMWKFLWNIHRIPTMVQPTRHEIRLKSYANINFSTETVDYQAIRFNDYTLFFFYKNHEIWVDAQPVLNFSDFQSQTVFIFFLFFGVKIYFLRKKVLFSCIHYIFTL